MFKKIYLKGNLNKHDFYEYFYLIIKPTEPKFRLISNFQSKNKTNHSIEDVKEEMKF